MDDDATLVPSPTLHPGTTAAPSSVRSTGSAGSAGIIHVNRQRLAPHRKVERSCILCHRRKIKCDKKHPCSTCTKTGVLCCYPASEQPTARRPRKTTIADVAERLVRLERTLVAISTTTSGEGGSSGADADAAEETPWEGGGGRGVGGEGRKEGGGGEGESPSVLEEFLLQNGDSSRYMNEILISRVLEEEDELRSVLGAQETVKPDLLHETDGDRFQPLDLGGLLSGYSPPCVNSLDMHPSKWQAMQLWQVFVSYVDMMNKVLHIPTTEIVVFKAIDDPSSAPADVNCLLFSVYFSAVTAMEDDAVVALLGQSKRRALSNFRRGLEVSLVQADFLEAPTLTSLQSMGIFLQTIRAHNTGRSVWVLCGLVIRAAQSMGLHRDGKGLGLPVFETELRRRLWWCINANDGRVAEDHSITVNTHDPSTNIEFASNVDDSQLYPGMTEFPKTRGKWSEMSLPLVMKEHCLARRKLYQAAPPLSATLPPESVRREIVDGVIRHCEETYFRYCNPVVPAQRAAMLIGRAVLAKLDFVSRLQWLSMANQNTTRGLLATDETLDEACGILEYGTQLVTDELLRNYRWISDVYPQYHVLLYVLWRLCVRPTGRHVERAWEAVEISFRIEFGRIGFENSPPGSKWTVLKAFREKAAKIRDMVAEGKGPVNGASEGQQGGQTDVVRDAVVVTDEIGNGFAWNLQDADLPDWNDLVEDFKLDGYDIQI
ncbi:fungal-specific transcription factor [Coniochaeta sp. 2T2.1]|nr:fungal-specific transcription factor [Coniochaeta sp. 2T2.1]